jgi:mRNA interferase RelE/StbE
MFDIAYHPGVVHGDIPKLTPAWKKKMQTRIQDRLSVHPDLYGKPLRRSLAGYRKLRVGDYRVVFEIQKTTIKILMIEHRSVVYTQMKKRV